MTPPKIYFVAGEASGDNHGGALMRSLRELNPSLEFLGRGGPQMKAIAGAPFHDWINDAAVVGLWEVIKNYGYFRKQFRQTLEEISRTGPDAVVLIDYPGFNLRLARALQNHNGARKIIYYVSPQVWAWNRGRIKQMARCVDLMLCIFPFETDLYKQAGLRAQFVGHPMVERLRAQQIDTGRDQNLIAILPGSLWREVRKILPIMLETIRYLNRGRPGLRFEIAAASNELAAESKTMIEEVGSDSQSIEIKTGDSSGVMQRAFVGIIASGSATLEAAYFRLPFVLVYKVSWLTYLAARAVVKIEHLGMPNVLAGRTIIPEFIQHEAKPSTIAEAILRLIDQPQERASMVSNFDQVIASLGDDGASRHAAEAILLELGCENSGQRGQTAGEGDAFPGS